LQLTLSRVTGMCDESDELMEPGFEVRPPDDSPERSHDAELLVFSARAVTIAPDVALRVYPELDLPRSSAFVDLFVAISFFLIMFVTPQAGEVMSYVADRFPEYGVLWSNVIIGVASIGIVFVILLSRRQRLSTIGLGRFRWTTFAAAVGAVPACYAAMMMTGMMFFLFEMVFSGIDFQSVLEEKQALIDLMPQFSISTMLLFGLLTGFHEELLFRGLLLTRLNAIFRNRAVAVIVSAALFGLVHSYQGLMGVVQTASIGLALGTISTLSRSLWPAILGHAAFNSIQLAILPLIAPYLNGVTENVSSMPAG
jgi:CAAX protease family protein